ncbi:hypothetical protein O3P69_019481 [Scylla paramamosain]|uniref:Sulfotransferase domain-containing protein n=1 Tax=Scylla paramamosain TaxID=85552 RepID=A0AAW0T001_SCYPA
MTTAPSEAVEGQAWAWLRALLWLCHLCRMSGQLTPLTLPPTNQRPSPQGSPDTRSAKTQLVESQQVVALNALQFGYKLTQAQKKLLQDLTPKARRELEERTAKTRIAQDRVYLTHLRHKHQIVPRRGGGEEIVSLANRTIRFPVLLKKAPLELWPEQYRVYYNLTHYPWVKSKDCERFSTTFTPPGTLPTRGLASFPSSGNTWVRYLIEGATGIFTGSMYDDTSLMMKGMYGEWLVYNSGMTVVQKSHGFTTGEAMTLDRDIRTGHNHLQELGYQGVVVIRNPFKALISHRHLDVGGHTGFAPKAHFLGQGWVEFVTLKIRLWRDFYEDWVRKTQPNDICVTHYELLREDPVREMRGILKYLKIPEDKAREAAYSTARTNMQNTCTIHRLPHFGGSVGMAHRGQGRGNAHRICPSSRQPAEIRAEVQHHPRRT